jgi:phosphoribosylformylglycinamidine cyclo-ligase
MSHPVSYAEAGVNRRLRAKSKVALKALEQTHKFSHYGEVLQLPYGKIFPIGDRYLDLAIEGVGTKVLLAQLAEKYDTIGIDGVAMTVNDVIRSGAKPLAIVDNIHAQISDPFLVEEWMKGLVQGAAESNCIVAGGEIGDVAEIIRGIRADKGFDLVVACIGELDKQRIIFGNNIKAGDVVIGLPSSGVHSNGVTLARKILFKHWGGKFDPYDVPEGLNRELIYEVLEPTRIYAKPLQAVLSAHRIKGAVHITGDAYLKFNRLMKFSQGIGFEFHNFKSQGIFELIETTAEAYGGISDEEMLKTFNMGWGFAVVVDKLEQDDVLSTLKRSHAEVIGTAKSSEHITAAYKGKELVLT